MVIFPGGIDNTGFLAAVVRLLLNTKRQ